MSQAMRPRYDVIVIGSGFGGAIAAMRLAQAGRSVCILERGRRFHPNDFPRTLAQVRDHGLWRDGRSYGLIEYRAFKNMDVIQGAGVGGGSLHYFNVHLRTPREIFLRKEWPRAVRREVMDPYYDLVQDMMESKPLEGGERLSWISPKTLAFKEAAHAAGRCAEMVPLAVHTDAARRNRQSIEQGSCTFCAGCFLGCRGGAKNTLDRNYIPAGERHGLEVFPLHPVLTIEPAEGGYRVAFQRLDPTDPRRAPEPGNVIGKQVIVAAGSLGSTEILLKSRSSLPNLSPALGQYFSGNGDMLFAGTLKTARSIEPGQGLPITMGAEFSKPGSKHRIFIEDLGFPNEFMWMLETMLPSPQRIANKARSAGSYLARMTGLGPQDKITFEAERLFAGGQFDRFMPYLGMGTDARDGVLRLKNGQIDLDWDSRGSEEMFSEMIEGIKALSRGAGGTYLPSPLWVAGKRLLTAHPLGGCVMSDSRDTGVVNDRGEVFGHPGLYVCDGAIIPGPLSVNPSLTIGAIAERVAYHMINGRELAASFLKCSQTNNSQVFSSEISEYESRLENSSDEKPAGGVP